MAIQIGQTNSGLVIHDEPLPTISFDHKVSLWMFTMTRTCFLYNGVVCVIELNVITINDTDSCVRPEGRKRTLFQQVFPELNTRGILTICFSWVRLRCECT